MTGRDNDELRRFGHSLATFMYEALQFLTYNTEHKPFPFADWPDLPAKKNDVADVHVVNPQPAEAGDDIVDETREVVEEDEHKDAEHGTTDEPGADTPTDDTGKR